MRWMMNSEQHCRKQQTKNDSMRPDSLMMREPGFFAPMSGKYHRQNRIWERKQICLRAYLNTLLQEMVTMTDAVPASRLSGHAIGKAGWDAEASDAEF